jgi:hypothetical protein
MTLPSRLSRGDLRRDLDAAAAVHLRLKETLDGLDREELVSLRKELVSDFEDTRAELRLIDKALRAKGSTDV